MTNGIILPPKLVERFWFKVIKTESCWNWNGAKDREGYGYLWNGYELMGAHRFSYILHYGFIPEESLVCHHCDNPSCVKPEHLFEGTNSDNQVDCLKKGRGNRNWIGQKVPGKKRCKLNKAQVLKIKELLVFGFKCKDIGNIFGVTKGNISHIKNGHIWKGK